MRSIRVPFALGAVSLLPVLAACGGGGGVHAGSASLVTLTTTSVPSGTTGVMYSAQFEADFPNPPGVFQVVGGTLPLGITLDKDTGTASGTARQVGSFHFSVAARDGIDLRLPPGRDENFAEDI